MVAKLGLELAEIEKMSISQPKKRYAEVFGEEPRAGDKVWRQKKIAWRIQAIGEGNLPHRARERAAEFANDADVRVTAPKPKVGAGSGVGQVGPT